MHRTPDMKTAPSAANAEAVEGNPTRGPRERLTDDRHRNTASPPVRERHAHPRGLRLGPCLPSLPVTVGSDAEPCGGSAMAGVALAAAGRAGPNTSGWVTLGLAVAALAAAGVLTWRRGRKR